MAMKRGKTRNAMGSMARARSASICSVTTIVPSSAVLFAPTRPEIMSAVSSGAISRSVAEAGAPAEEALCAEALDDGRGLDHHDGAREERGDDDDRQRLDRHLVEVASELGVVEHRRPGEPPARTCARSTPMPPTVCAMPMNAVPVPASVALQRPTGARLVRGGRAARTSPRDVTTARASRSRRPRRSARPHPPA